MLMILMASTIGVISGLYVDFYLCIALLFLLILLSVFWNIDIKKVSAFISCLIIFHVYTSIQVDMYDNKYQNGVIEGDFKIISYKEESNYYDKYIAKSGSGDKFLLYIKSGSMLKKGEIIHAMGEFVFPDESRNTGSFNYRRFLNSQKIFGSIFIEDYFLTDLGKFNLIYYIQDEIYNSLGKLFPKNEMGLVLGMIIGETKDISDDIMEAFRDTRNYSFSCCIRFKCNLRFNACTIYI